MNQYQFCENGKINEMEARLVPQENKGVGVRNLFLMKG